MNRPVLVSNNSIPNGIINLNGYFYEQSPYGVSSFFLYENGIYLYIGLGGSDIKSLETHENYIREFTNKNNEKNVYTLKQQWGVYEVDNNRIKITSYFPIGYGGYSTRTFEGNIIDDENMTIYAINSEKLEEPRLYRFRSYSPKPDSTNIFIK